MKTKKDLKIFGAVVIVLLIIGALADLQISHFLYNPKSVFGKLFEAIGEFPASVIGSFGAMSMAVVQKKRNNGKFSLKSAGSLLLGILLGLMAGFLPVKYFGGPNAAGVVLAVVVLVFDYYIARNISRSREEELYKAAVLGIQLFLLVLLLFNLMKLGWGRERYRHMIEIGSFAGFSPWFLPQGLASGNEFMSFPSGHSANGAMMIWITLLPTFLPALETKEKMLKVIVCIWTVCVMVSRVIMGAHFLSDVTAGMTITFSLFYLLYQKKYQRKN